MEQGWAQNLLNLGRLVIVSPQLLLPLCNGKRLHLVLAINTNTRRATVAMLLAGRCLKSAFLKNPDACVKLLACVHHLENLVPVMSREWDHRAEAQCLVVGVDETLGGFPPTGFHPPEFPSTGKQKQNQSSLHSPQGFLPFTGGEGDSCNQADPSNQETFEREERMGLLMTGAGLWFRSFPRNKCKPFSLKFRLLSSFQS